LYKGIFLLYECSQKREFDTGLFSENYITRIFRKGL